GLAVRRSYRIDRAAEGAGVERPVGTNCRQPLEGEGDVLRVDGASVHRGDAVPLVGAQLHRQLELVGAELVALYRVAHHGAGQRWLQVTDLRFEQPAIGHRIQGRAGVAHGVRVECLDIRSVRVRPD